MNICFFGTGGVGGYFGTLVTRKFKGLHNIYFIARGSHLDAINRNGLTLKKNGGKEIINVSPDICINATQELPVCDIIFVSVKAYDLPNAVKEISKITNENTIILPLLNGVDIYQRIREQLQTGIVLPSCVYIGTHIESPGVIYQQGGSCKILMGCDPKFPDFVPKTLINILNESEIDFSCEENVNISIWSKFMFIAAYGLVTATFNKTLGEILDDRELSAITQSIMKEIEKIARKLDIPLEQDIVETSFSKAQQFPFETKTSFQRDVEHKGKINESDLFGGTLMRLGNSLNIPTPTVKDIYEKLLKRFN